MGNPGWRYYVVAIDADFNEIGSEIFVYGKTPQAPKPKTTSEED